MSTAQTILITGASSGIGLALTRSLCAAGNTVIGLGRNTTALNHLKEQLGERFVSVTVDLADNSALNDVLGRIKSGPLPQWVILNAGVFRANDSRNTDEYIRAVNYSANVCLMEGLAGLGVKDFVLVSSIMAFLPDTKLPAYGKSKEDITKEFNSLKQRGIISERSFVAFPGPVQQNAGFIKGGFTECAAAIAEGMQNDGQDIYYPGFWRNALKLVNLFPKALVRFTFKILRPGGGKR